MPWHSLLTKDPVSSAVWVSSQVLSRLLCTPNPLLFDWWCYTLGRHAKKQSAVNTDKNSNNISKTSPPSLQSLRMDPLWGFEDSELPSPKLLGRMFFKKHYSLVFCNGSSLTTYCVRNNPPLRPRRPSRPKVFRVSLEEEDSLDQRDMHKGRCWENLGKHWKTLASVKIESQF